MEWTTRIIKASKQAPVREVRTLLDLWASVQIEPDEAIEEGAKLIAEGCNVAFPTETVYGLGADACNRDAVRRIFEAKGRPSDNPLIVHISSLKMLKELLLGDNTKDQDMSWIPVIYQALMVRFWPGSLTLLFPYQTLMESRLKLADLTLAGQTTVGIRFPSHPIAEALISLSNTPIAAPSANRSGRPSPTNAKHVFADMQGRIPLIIDANDNLVCDIGVESTVLDGGFRLDQNLAKTSLIPRILRPGGTTLEQIRHAWLEDGRAECLEAAQKIEIYRRGADVEEVEQNPRTPGMKYRHYAPKAKIDLVDGQPKDYDWGSIMDNLLAKRSQNGPNIGILDLQDIGLKDFLIQHSTEQGRIITFDLERGACSEQKAEIAGKALYNALRTLDESDCGIIIISALTDETGLGAAIMERVRKAAG